LLSLGSQKNQTDAVIADQLRRSGLAVEVRELEVQALMERLLSGSFDGALLARSGASPVDLEGCFRSGGEDNYAGLSDPDLDRLLAARRGEADPDRARSLFREACRRIADLQPWTFLFYRSDSVAARPQLRGIEANPRDPLAVVERWWIQADAR
jgi:peptide/nickel transport system substrate-binding protein